MGMVIGWGWVRVGWEDRGCVGLGEGGMEGT